MVLVIGYAVARMATTAVAHEIGKFVFSNAWRAGRHVVSTSVSPTKSGEESGDEEQKAIKEVQANESTEYLVMNWFEAVFAWSQMILFWHYPWTSFCVLSGVLTFSTFLIHVAPNFYVNLIILAFVYNLIQFWFRHVWPEIRVPPEKNEEEESKAGVDRWIYLHPQLISKNEFASLLSKTWGVIRLHIISNFISLRRDKHRTFCFLVCSILLCTASVGNLISGLTLFYTSLIIVIAAPGIYLHILPDPIKENLKSFWESISSNISNINNISINSNISCANSSRTTEGCRSASSSLLSSNTSLLDELPQPTDGEDPDTLDPKTSIPSTLFNKALKLIPTNLLSTREETSEEIIKLNEDEPEEDENQECIHIIKPSGISSTLNTCSEQAVDLTPTAKSVTLFTDSDDEQEDGFVIL